MEYIPTAEISTETPGVIFVMIFDGCTKEHIENAAKTLICTKNFTRTNIASGDDVSMDVINHAVKKFCTEIKTSTVYVDAPKHNKTQIIYPTGVKIIN